MHYLEDLDRQENDLVGKVLCGKWRVLRRIGRGGMSTVYEASHRNGRKVAVKVLRRHFAANRRIVARFLREGYVANKIRHPGAVAILDDDVDADGTVFLVMELLDGCTLAERYSGSTPAPLGEILQTAERLLDVLVAAHDGGVVHRDVKPSNVFLTNDEAVMLLDFGIARLHESESDTGSTHSGATLGTPGFMAPEQARGRGNLVDARTDIWAVGAVLFFLLTGRTVHEAETPNELLIASATQPARSVGEFCVELPPSIAEIVDRALEMDREKRWPDARSMKEALAAARGSLSEAALRLGVARAVGMGGTSTVPETHTAEPSVVSPKERGLASQPSTRTSRRQSVLAWSVGAGVVASGLVATLLMRPSGGVPPRVDPSPALSALGKANGNVGEAPDRTLLPPAPTVESPSAQPPFESPEVRQVAAATSTNPPSQRRPSRPPTAEAPAVAPRASARAPSPAASTAVDILDLRR